MSSYKNHTTQRPRITLELLYLPSFEHRRATLDRAAYIACRTAALSKV